MSSEQIQVHNQDATDIDIINTARVALATQVTAISHMAEKLDNNFVQAVHAILNTNGRVIICGMGKSGLVGKKMAATLASTGTPSFFIHLAEAFHGDLGMITEQDVVVILSNSGETREVIQVLPSLKKFGNYIIGIVGDTSSTLAKHSDVVLDISVERESCPNNLAPTTSTLTTMAMGDALAIILIKLRNFKAVDFARFHPGGSLGRRLLTRVKDVMHTKLPITQSGTSLREAILTMTDGRMGLALVMDQEKLKGIITDGDLRRSMLKGIESLDHAVDEFMTINPATISEEAMFADAEQTMIERKIKALVAVNNNENVTGIVEIFD